MNARVILSYMSCIANLVRGENLKTPLSIWPTLLYECYWLPLRAVWPYVTGINHRPRRAILEALQPWSGK